MPQKITAELIRTYPRFLVDNRIGKDLPMYCNDRAGLGYVLRDELEADPVFATLVSRIVWSREDRNVSFWTFSFCTNVRPYPITIDKQLFYGLHTRLRNRG